MSIGVVDLDLLNECTRGLNTRFKHSHSCLKWWAPSISKYKVKPLQVTVVVNSYDLNITQVLALCRLSLHQLGQVPLCGPIKFKGLIIDFLALIIRVDFRCQSVHNNRRCHFGSLFACCSLICVRILHINIILIIDVFLVIIIGVGV